MRKAFFASVLLLACGLAPRASAADLTPADPGSLGIPQPTFMTSCTVSCYPNPYSPGPPLSCTSASGNCYHYSPKGVEMISCDGVNYFCPTYF